MNNMPYISGGYEVSTWYDHQIFDGIKPVVMGVSNYVVPAVGDFIVTIIGGTETKRMVTAVVDRIATTEPVTCGGESDLEQVTDELRALAVVLMRTSVTPVIGTVHIGLPIESDIPVKYAKVFVGRTIENIDTVVSRRYDNDGVVIDDTIEVTRDDLNTCVYHIEQFSLDRILDDKASGTLVVYGVDDTPLATYSITFRECNHLVNYSGKGLFITDLVIESPLINEFNEREILVNKGYLNRSFSPRVFKVYNTGQREEIPITDHSLKLEGWGNYIFGEDDETAPLSIQYRLGHNEQSDMISSENGDTITSNYTIRIVDDSNSIVYKLYPLVIWDEGMDVYSLKLMLFDTTYRTSVDVTPMISLNRPFTGFDYDNTQLFNFGLNLKDAGVSAEDYNLNGSFSIRLISKPMQSNTPFKIHMVPTDEVRYYGRHLRTVVKFEFGKWSVGISSGYTTFEEWLDNAYHKLLPQYDGTEIIQAPTPEYCMVTIGKETVTIPLLGLWNSTVNLDAIPDMVGTAILEWCSDDSMGNRNQLAISTMQVEYV